MTTSFPTQEQAERVNVQNGTVLPWSVCKLSVNDYHRMIQAGILTEEDQVELLEGWLVPKMVKNPLHDAVVDLINDILSSSVPEGWRIRVQSAITTSDSEPEPDLTVCRGNPRDYLERHPGPAEIALGIEVADSSLARDRAKQRLYARTGIPAYWLVNVSENVIEAHGEPTGVGTEAAGYAQVRHYARGEEIPFAGVTEATLRIAVVDLLP